MSNNEDNKPPSGNDKRVLDFVFEIVDAPAKNIVGLADDWLKYFRYKNLLKIRDKVDALHSIRAVQGKRSLPPKYAIPLIETASLEEEASVQDIWSRLIANSTDPDFSEPYHPAYVDIIKQLSPDEAVIIQAFTEINTYPILFSDTNRTRADWASFGRNGEPSSLIDKYRTFAGELDLRNPDSDLSYLDNLERLKLI